MLSNNDDDIKEETPFDPQIPVNFLDNKSSFLMDLNLPNVGGLDFENNDDDGAMVDDPIRR